jgi:hypothetical protein
LDYVEVWDMKKSIRVTKITEGNKPWVFSDRGWVLALCALPDGRFATGSHRDKMIRLWHLESGVEAASLKGIRLQCVYCVYCMTEGGHLELADQVAENDGAFTGHVTTTYPHPAALCACKRFVTHLCQ